MVGNMNYHFSVMIAKEVGVDGAIMLENMHYWIVVNKANNRNIYDGEAWTYNTKKAFSELFPFWSEKQIRRILDNLIKDGYLKTGNYNKSSYDRTLWYTLTEKGWNLWNFNISPNGPIVQTEQANEMDQMGQPIPYIKTDKKQNTYKEQCDTLWKMYPSKTGKKIAYMKMPALLKKYSLEELQRCIERYMDDVDKRRKTFPGLQYKNGSTFFSSGYEDYLDENYAGNDIIDQKEGDNTYDEEYFRSLLNKDNRL